MAESSQGRDELSGCRGIAYGLLFSFGLWSIILTAIVLLRLWAQPPEPPCSCTGKEKCKEVEFPTRGGKVARGVMWGQNQSCLVIGPGPQK